MLGLEVLEKIKFVGTWTTLKGHKEDTQLNYEQVIKKIDLVLRSWTWRYIIPIGAQVIIRSLMASSAVHIMQNFIPPAEWIEETNKKFHSFIWKSLHRFKLDAS